MKLEIEIPDSAIETAIRDAAKRGDWTWRQSLEARAVKAIEESLQKQDLAELAERYVSRLVHEVLEDQVRARLRHVVKLAVDNELATARIAEQIRAQAVSEPEKVSELRKLMGGK